MAVSYELVTIRPPDRATGYIADFALTRSVAFAVGGYDGRPTILSSSDGLKFVPLNPPDVSGLRSIWVDRHGGVRRLVVVGEFGSIFVSEDETRRWRLVDSGVENCLFAIAHDHKESLFVGGHDGFLIRSTDRGDSWRRIDCGVPGAIARLLAMGDGRVLAAARGLAIVDGDRVTRCEMDASPQLYGLTRTPRGSLLAVGSGGVIWRSTDGAASWQRVASATAVELEAVACAGHLVVAAGQGGALLVSTDDGASFTATTVDGGDLHGMVSYGSGVLIGGLRGRIMGLVTEGGARWCGVPTVEVETPEPPRPEGLSGEAWWSPVDRGWMLGSAASPRQGSYRLFRAGGALAAELEYKDGVLDGAMRRFHPDGSVARECTMVGGHPEGVVKMYRPRADSKEAPFPAHCAPTIVELQRVFGPGGAIGPEHWIDATGEERLPDGAPLPPRPPGIDPDAFYWTQVDHWCHGVLDPETGKRTGRWRWWRTDGTMSSEEEYDATGLLRRQTRYCEDGVTRDSETRHHPNGRKSEYRSWNPDGKLSYHTVDDPAGLRTLHASYYPDGTIECEERWSRTSGRLSQWQRIGEGGVLEGTAERTDGRLIVSLFHRQGALGARGPATGELRAHGRWQLYDPQGQPVREVDVDDLDLDELSDYRGAGRLVAEIGLIELERAMPPAPAELAGVDDVPWAALDATVPGTRRFPVYLRALVDPALRGEALASIAGQVEHRGSSDDATVQTVPFLVRLLEHPTADPAALMRALIGFALGAAVHGPDRSAAIKELVAAGALAAIRLLHHADPDVRQQASRMLSIAAGADRDGARAALWALHDREPDESRRADLVLGLGLLVDAEPDLARVIARVAGGGPLERVCAALAVVRSAVAPPAAIDAAAAVLVDALAADPELAARYAELSWADDTLIADIAIALGQFRPQVRELVVPRALEALKSAPAPAALSIVHGLLLLTSDDDDFEDDDDDDDGDVEYDEARQTLSDSIDVDLDDDDDDDDDAVPELGPLQRRVLRAIADAEALWQWVNLTELLDAFDLPTDRDELRSWSEPASDE